MFSDKFFTYKNHKLSIEMMEEDDCVKAWHSATLPDGSKRFADISPYDRSEQTFRLWVDAGYPKRIGCGPLHREDLEKMIKDSCPV
jgi:hypothetical protein